MPAKAQPPFTQSVTYRCSKSRTEKTHICTISSSTSLTECLPTTSTIMAWTIERPIFVLRLTPRTSGIEGSSGRIRARITSALTGQRTAKNGVPEFVIRAGVFLSACSPPKSPPPVLMMPQQLNIIKSLLF